MFDLAVILINYNSSEFTIPCLEKVYEKTSKLLSFQVIVVDNCSADEDYQKVKEFCQSASLPNLSCYQTDINCGFGRGNNFGFLQANAHYVAFLNNDTLLLNDCFHILIPYLEQHPTVGMVGAQAFKENGDFMVSLDHFASPTREIMGRSLLELIAPASHPKRKKQHQKPVKVDFVPGSFMLLRSTDFDKGTGKSMAIKKEIKISLLYVLRKHYGNWSMQLVRVFLILKYGLSSLIKSKNRELFQLVWRGAPLSDSLQHQQVPRK